MKFRSHLWRTQWGWFAALRDFAGEPVTFKLEGVLQGCEVHLVLPQTITAQGKKHDFTPPAALNKYQHEAWKSACALMFVRR